MSDEVEAEFEKADAVLADALQRFQAEGVSQYVYGVAMLEIGLLALVKLDEDDAAIRETVESLLTRLRESGGPSPVPTPRQ